MNREGLEKQASSLDRRASAPTSMELGQGGTKIHGPSAHVRLLQVPGAIESEQAALALQQSSHSAAVRVWSVFGITLGTYASAPVGLSHVTSLETVCQ